MADETETPIETAPEAPATVAVPVEPAAPDVVPMAEAVAETSAPSAKRGRKPKAEAALPEPELPESVPATPATAEAAPAQGVPAEPVAAPAKVRKTRQVAVKPARKIAAAKVPVVKTALRKAPAPAAPAKNTTVTTPKNTVGIPTLSQLKDKLMAKTIPTDFTANFQSAFSDIQEKAKTAYEKSTEALGEANDFAKGNVEALVESGKVLASGLQELGSAVVADSKSAFEAITADVKELAAVKSPTEFFQLQSALLRKNFDGAVAQASKNTEAFIKLASDAFTPISSRVSLAVEKVSKVA